ncbi:extracellular solute-binding protein [Halotalea alkalilenta]|uniref:Spermidine/putrescine ABC transporter substrate-binding protein n=1 Tax=Halotalea alkalilenta TaxID=376489 RepID=A0A172YEL7_9GAMM|nr:extracellular solute-binding protein [Halotalea alkalilenta]ANF57673.1 hypothetical protein A5892_09525 [Halotalea alkalilenta]
MKETSVSQLQLLRSRRDFLRSAALGASALALPLALDLPASRLWAAGPATVRGYGVTTSQLKDWSVMAQSIGVQMEFTGTGNDVGVFLRDVVAAGLGDQTDIFVFEAGTQDILGPRGTYLPIDTQHPALTLWERTPDEWKHSRVVQDAEGNQWGVPVIGNADSFGYFPEKLGLDPDSEEELSWSLVFDDPRTRGRVSFDRTWGYSLPMAALYLQSKTGKPFSNCADLEPEETRQVVDFLIERKRAGQFRTLHTSFEEQIQLLSNREVDVINCWEPAVREVNLKLGKDATRYAYTQEGYYKWGHGAYLPVQAGDRDNLDAIYKVLNYYLGGEYRALQARDRGYAGPNMDLAVAYARENDWSAEDIAALEETERKIARKFSKPLVSTTTPSNADSMEEQWQRFLNA